MLRQKLRALFFHLGCSVLVAALAACLVFGIWYPAPLHRAMDVSGLFVLILIVDVTLGPLLTFVVYNQKKKYLAQELIFICALQIGALAYGMHTVAEGRPVWLVFNVDRFDAVRVIDLDVRGIADAGARYRNASFLGPVWVASKMPDDPAERQRVLFESVLGGYDMQHRPELYQPVGMQAKEMQHRSKPLNLLKQYNQGADVDAAISAHPAAQSWIPLMAKKPMVVLLGEGEDLILGVVDLNPW